LKGAEKYSQRKIEKTGGGMKAQKKGKRKERENERKERQRYKQSEVK
jgi:hypothetical protein